MESVYLYASLVQECGLLVPRKKLRDGPDLAYHGCTLYTPTSILCRVAFKSSPVPRGVAYPPDSTPPCLGCGNNMPLSSPHPPQNSEGWGSIKFLSATDGTIVVEGVKLTSAKYGRVPGQSELFICRSYGPSIGGG